MRVRVETHHGRDANGDAAGNAAGNAGRNGADATWISGDGGRDGVVIQHGSVRVNGAGR